MDIPGLYHSPASWIRIIAKCRKLLVEKNNQDLMVNGEMSREDYSEYAVELAKDKKMELAWKYVMEQKE